MPKLQRTAVPLWCACLLTVQLSACSSDPGRPDTGRITVVASTDVWGDIAKQIGGPAVDVISLIDSPTQDPHAFEANAHDDLDVSKAAVLIENGGGYDDFMATLRRSAGAERTELLDAVQISGKHAVDGRLNEHVWYDLPTVGRFVARLAGVLSRKDPASRGTFRRNAAAFAARLEQLRHSEAQVASTYRGEGVAITEVVPLYLLQACGLRNRTPLQFSDAVEEGTGVPVSVLRRTVELFSTRAVRLLVYNAQTAGVETTDVRTAAEQAGIPVVAVTETVPPGKSYLAWMTDNVSAVRSALSTAAGS
jgi:zinc/manganese transport system substrate-binding protein